MAQDPDPIQDDESEEPAERGSPKRPYRRMRWLAVIILAVLLFIFAWAFGPGEWGSDDEGAEASAGQFASVSRSSLR